MLELMCLRKATKFEENLEFVFRFFMVFKNYCTNKSFNMVAVVFYDLEKLKEHEVR